MLRCLQALVCAKTGGFTLRLSIFLFLSLFLLSSKSIACPDLTGTYTCTNSQGASTTLTITQETIAGNTIFTFTENGETSHLPSDNAEYPFENHQNNTSGSARFYCDQKGFHSRIRGERRGAKNQPEESWDITQSISRNENGDLVTSTQGSVSLVGVKNEIHEQSSCRRLNADQTMSIFQAP
jgi:hypothetical protein